MSYNRRRNSEASPFFIQAARASVFVPFIAMCAGVVLTVGQAHGVQQQDDLSRLAPGLISAVLIPLGLVLAFWGFVGAVINRKYGTMIIGVIGLALNGFIVCAAITSFSLAKKVAEKRRAEQAKLASDDWIPKGEGWHVDREARFAIQFPDGWEVVEQPQPGITVYAVSPIDGLTDTFRENIVITAGRAGPRDEPLDFMTRELNAARSQGIQVKEHRRGTKEIRGVVWHLIEYDQITPVTSAEVIAYTTIRHGQAYVVVCSNQFGARGQFGATFNAAIDSLHVP